MPKPALPDDLRTVYRDTLWAIAHDETLPEDERHSAFGRLVVLDKHGLVPDADVLVMQGYAQLQQIERPQPPAPPRRSSIGAAIARLFRGRRA